MAMGEGFIDLGMHDFTVKWSAFPSPADGPGQDRRGEGDDDPAEGRR
jgi:hypothetical protein